MTSRRAGHVPPYVLRPSPLERLQREQIKARLLGWGIFLSILSVIIGSVTAFAYLLASRY